MFIFKFFLSSLAKKKMSYGIDQLRELRKKRLGRRQEAPAIKKPAAFIPSPVPQAMLFGVKVAPEETSPPAVATARVLQQVSMQEELKQLRARVEHLSNPKWFYATPIDTQPLYMTRDSVSAEVVTQQERVLLLYPLEEDQGGNVWVTVRRLFDNGTIEDYMATFYAGGQLRFRDFTFSNASCT